MRKVLVGVEAVGRDRGRVFYAEGTAAVKPYALVQEP